VQDKQRRPTARRRGRHGQGNAKSLTAQRTAEVRDRVRLIIEITARAGLTTRTFFRHFADKREVLFGGPEIPALATQLIAAAPASLDPVTMIFGGLQTVAEDRFEGRRQDLRERRAIIRSDRGLRERDARKRADLSEAIRTGFAGRGVPATTAALLGDVTVTLLYVALDEWLDTDDDRTLFEVMLEPIGSLQATLATFPPFPIGPASRQLPDGRLPDTETVIPLR